MRSRVWVGLLFVSFLCRQIVTHVSLENLYWRSVSRFLLGQKLLSFMVVHRISWTILSRETKTKTLQLYKEIFLNFCQDPKCLFCFLNMYIPEATSENIQILSVRY